MRLSHVVASVAMVALIVAPASANPPLDGMYTSMDGDMLEGRGSESWVAGADLELGNTLNWDSWDGATLATQWYLSCPALCLDPELILDTVDGNGNGFRIYELTYCDGVLWLAGDGPWSNGDPDYTADFAQATSVVTIQFVQNNPVGWIQNLNVIGTFLNAPETCIDLLIANGVRLGDTGSGNFPADYPDLVLGPNCDPAPDGAGSWWDISGITMTITGCAVPVEDTTWGRVKSSYR